MRVLTALQRGKTIFILPVSVHQDQHQAQSNGQFEYFGEVSVSSLNLVALLTL